MNLCGLDSSDRRALWIAALLFLLAGTLPAQDSPFPDRGLLLGMEGGAVVLKPGRMYQHSAEFGFVQVSKNRNDPHSRLAPLPFIRHHVRKDSVSEPIFILGGGPGKINRWGEMPEVFCAHNDVMNMGYRGVDGEEQLENP